ncbi:hypothetical protein N0V84_011050 [Fusarium piperis]|uniref:Uncharacterized protein n=1 Tax=Fusarium piperis TaxID=1435070 RepID=A0A9W8TEM1_9HYPO|nr:hypothetical protein N0V84_011050 [Fusarium piperis]
MDRYIQQLTQRPGHQRDEVVPRRANPTTLDEYLTACHELVFSGFAVETDSRDLSSGYAAVLLNKPCPKLKPWVGFIDQQRLTFGKLYDALEPGTRVFENRDVMERLQKARCSRKPIGDETFLRFFLRDSFEKPVEAIISELAKIEKVREAFQIGDGFEFVEKNDLVMDVLEAANDGRMPFSAPPGSCVYRKDKALAVQQRLVYVADRKLPHMLTAPRLRVGLREMDVHEEAATRDSMLLACRGSTARFRYHAEKLTAHALTDVYDQLIEEGLKYGLVTTGEATVFLKLDWDEPGTLHYHLAEFGPEVSAAHPSDAPMCTAVGQHLAFSLVALRQRSRHSQQERGMAMTRLKTWKADFVEIWRSIPESERWALPEGYREPITYEGIDRSPKSALETSDDAQSRDDEGRESSEDESIFSWDDVYDCGDWPSCLS